MTAETRLDNGVRLLTPDEAAAIGREIDQAVAAARLVGCGPSLGWASNQGPRR
jgi:hypothetical protein